MSERDSSQVGGGEVASLLSSRALRALRSEYDREVMAATATAALVRDFPESEEYVTAIHDSLFGAEKGRRSRSLAGLTDKEREVGLIVLMASQRATMELAIHIYWGLMEGVRPHEIAGLLMLTGVYAGIGRQTAGMKVMRATLLALQARYDSTEDMSAEDTTKALSTVPVLYAMVDAFA
jgi:alkylhydroperoxidase/carboxymuconolactone decarboxylase family protein YurZ